MSENYTEQRQAQRQHHLYQETKGSVVRRFWTKVGSKWETEGSQLTSHFSSLWEREVYFYIHNISCSTHRQPQKPELRPTEFF